MKKTFLMSIFMCIYLNLSGQNASIDSLLNLLKTAKEDTNKANILFELSQESNQENMLKYALPAFELAEKLNYKSVLAGAANNVGLGYSILGNSNLALEYLKKSLKIKEEIGDRKSNIAVTLNNIGMAYGNLGNFPMELEYYNKSLKIREEFGDTIAIANSLASIGANYQKQDNFISALENYRKAEYLLKKTGSKIGQCRTLNNIGGVYQSLGDVSNALQCYFEGLKLGEEISDMPGVASCLKNIGYVYESQHDYSNAILYHTKCLKIREAINDQGGIAYALSNIGSVYYNLGDLTRSLDYYNISLKIHQELGQKRGLASTFTLIAAIYKDKGEFNEALIYCKKGLTLFREINQPTAIAKTLNTIGNIYLLKLDFKQAENYCRQSFELSKRTGSPDNIRIACESLSKVFSLTGKYKEAFEMHVMFKQMADSINNQETQKATVKKQMSYEFEKRDAVAKSEHEKKEVLASAEIKRQRLMKNSILGGVGIAGIFSFVLVHTFNRKKKSAFEKQVAQVETRALRAQMDPHFIYNSLNSIDDYILRNDIKNSSLYVNKFSRLMRLILESSRREEVTLNEDLESLEIYMQLENLRMPKKVDCKIEVAPGINPDNILIPPMLLQPFIENAFKHAFHGIESPKLEINISLKDEMLQCTVTDNGNGRKNIQKLETEKKDNRQSLGMIVTKERLDIISKLKKSNATYAFEDLLDGQQKALGTKVLLYVPASFAF